MKGISIPTNSRKAVFLPNSFPLLSFRPDIIFLAQSFWKANIIFPSSSNPILATPGLSTPSSEAYPAASDVKDLCTIVGSVGQLGILFSPTVSNKNPAHINRSFFALLVTKIQSFIAPADRQSFKFLRNPFKKGHIKLTLFKFPINFCISRSVTETAFITI